MRGLGVDLTAVDRMGTILRRHGDRFRARCFGPLERAPRPAETAAAETARLAAAWAAKEAFLKAAGAGLDRVPPRQIQLVPGGAAGSRLLLGPEARAALAGAGAEAARVAVTIGGGYAAAVVVLD